jgi:hypothetical protein
MIGIGDLVFHSDDPDSIGIVINVMDDVEIPSLIEIFWGESWHEYLSFCRCYADELTVVNKI